MHALRTLGSVHPGLGAHGTGLEPSKAAPDAETVFSCIWRKFLPAWNKAGEDLDIMWDVIEEVATAFHYLRADEKPGKPKAVGR
eukprot:7152935-Heterocapsa_arctica.AAC.1